MENTRTINWYLDRILSTQEDMSDRKMAALLHVSPSVINAYRHKNTFPSDDKMMEIALHAGVDAAIGLIDLNSWRAKDSPAYATYKEILKKISAIIIAVSICTSPLAAHASVKTEQCYYVKDTVYYGN